MRWRGNPYGWKRHFIWFPSYLNGEWRWLEWIERRFMGLYWEWRDVE